MAIIKLPSTGDKPRSSRTATGLPRGVFAGGVADSANIPWAGRSFEGHDTTFANDTGETPAEYAAAVAKVRSCAASIRDEAALLQHGAEELLHKLAEAHADCLKAIGGIRLLVPLTTDAGDFGITETGATVEKTQELSIVSVQARDGRKVMPVFSNVEHMKAWNPQARPIPIPAPQIVVAAREEGNELIIIDPKNEETEFGIRSTEFMAVALGSARVPAWARKDLAQYFGEIIEKEKHVLTWEILPADPQARLETAEIDLLLTFSANLDRFELDGAINRIHIACSSHPELMQEVDSLRLRIVSVE